MEVPNEARREMAASVTAEQLRLKPSQAFPEVWGVLLDQDLIAGSFMFVAFAEGAVSLYVGPHSGIIGAGTHERVHTASFKYLGEAQRYYATAEPIMKFRPADPGGVVFCLRGWGGDRELRLSPSDLLEKARLAYSLLAEAHRVITEIRLIDVQRAAEGKPSMSGPAPE